jgi:transposase
MHTAHRKIAEIIGRDHSTDTKFLKRFDTRSSVENKPKTGRKRLITELGDRESQQESNFERFDKHCK